jgi:hypothetical protein
MIVGLFSDVALNNAPTVLPSQREVMRDAGCCSNNEPMRKTIAGPRQTQPRSESDERWLDLEQIATVEVTSEDPSFPIESAFVPTDGPGWRASQGGEQQVRVIFDEPVSLHRIQLRFQEAEVERTQEFTLRWWAAEGGLAREIVRQQWNFSPNGSTTEERIMSSIWRRSRCWNSRFGRI